MYQSIIASGKKRSYRNKSTETLYPDDNQRFAVVKELLGNGRLNALCDDGVVRLGRIRGSMRSGPHKVVISRGDLIIVSERDYEDKVDVIHRYNHEEASTMFRKYKMPEIMVRVWNMEEGEVKSKTAEYVEFAESDDEVTADQIDSL